MRDDETPICNKCGLKMTFIGDLAYIHDADWWDCVCGQGLDRGLNQWVRE